MINIDEAIKHCEEVAEKNETKGKMIQNNFSKLRREQKQEIDSCLECANEHRQLAEWLRELKAYRGILANADKIIASEYGCVIIEGYKDVIDKMNEVYSEVNTDERDSN